MWLKDKQEDEQDVQEKYTSLQFNFGMKIRISTTQLEIRSHLKLEIN